MEKTRKELYEELLTVKDRHADFNRYMEALAALHEHMETLGERDENGKQKPVTDEQRQETMHKIAAVSTEYGRVRLQLSVSPTATREQNAAAFKQMDDMERSLKQVNRQMKHYDPSKGLKTLDDVQERAKQASDLHKLLDDRTNFLRGSSDNYRAVQAALKAVKDGGQAPTREQLLAIKEAAERYKTEKQQNIGNRERPANDYEKNRIDAVEQVLAYANEGLGLPAADNSKERAHREYKVFSQEMPEKLSEGASPEAREAREELLGGRDKTDYRVDKIVQHYQPTPVLDEESISSGGYTREQFKKLSKLDVTGLRIQGDQISNREFAALGVLATLDANIGGKYIAQGKKMVKVEEPNKLFAAENSTFTVTELGRSGGARDGCGAAFEQVDNKARKTAHNALKAYQSGDKEPLAKLIANGVTTTLDYMAHDVEATKFAMTDDQRGFNRMMLTALDAAKRDPQLMQIAEQNGLTKEHLKKAEALRRMDTLQHMAEQAEKKLKQGDLTPTQKEVCMDSMLCMNTMLTATKNAVAQKQNDETSPESQEIEELYAKDDELANQMADTEDEQEKEKLTFEKSCCAYRVAGLTHKLINVPKPIEMLGGNGALKGLQQQVNNIVPDKSGLMKLDGEQLLQTLKDPKLVAPDEAAKQKYANIYNPPAQQPKVEQKQQPQAGGPVV